MSVRRALFSVSSRFSVVSHADPLIIPEKRKGFNGYQHMRDKKIFKKHFLIKKIKKHH